jgi:hypothetical protein
MATTTTMSMSMKMLTTMTLWKRTTTTSRQLQLMRRKATNLMVIKECEDRDAEERVPVKSTPITVC